MKRIRINMLRSVSYLLAAILSLFGLEACIWSCEYGMPHADLKMSGTVTDKNNKPIKGIQVKVEEGFDIEHPILTDEDGRFTFETEVFPNSEMRVIATDIDSLENGLYAPDTVVVHPNYVKDKKDKNDWYSGKATIENVELKMEEIAPDEPKE